MSVPAGKCPEHGIVAGNNLEVQFPSEARCFCGETLERCTFVTEDEAAGYPGDTADV